MLWITGKVHSSFLQYLTQRDIPYGVFALSHQNASPDAAATVSLPLFDTSALHAEVQQLDPATVSAVVVAGYENYIIPAAVITQTLHLPGTTVEAAVAATDKTVMRQAFMDRAPAVTPDFVEVENWTTIEHFMATHPFPVMLKPANLMKSLLVYKNSDWDELRRNYTELTTGIAAAYGQQSVAAEPKIILESFLTGSMHTVAGFVDHTGQPQLLTQIADCQRAGDIGVDDSFLYSRRLPSQLPAADQTAILAVAAEGIKALSLTSCPVHVEVILTAQGPKIIEIGARTGGYRPLMYRDAFGIDLFAGIIDTAYSRPLTLTATKTEYSEVLELFPTADGSLTAISGLDNVSLLPSVQKVSSKVALGAQTGQAKHGYKATVIIVLQHCDYQQLETDSRYILETVSINVQSTAKS